MDFILFSSHPQSFNPSTPNSPYHIFFSLSLSGGSSGGLPVFRCSDCHHSCYYEGILLEEVLQADHVVAIAWAVVGWMESKSSLVIFCEASYGMSPSFGSWVGRLFRPGGLVRKGIEIGLQDSLLEPVLQALGQGRAGVHGHKSEQQDCHSVQLLSFSSCIVGVPSRKIQRFLVDDSGRVFLLQ